jgi:transposase-like protein
MTGHGTKFGRKKEAAVAAVLSQRNLEEAARVAGIGVATLLRWQKLPEFQEALRRARREALSQTINRLQQGSSAAATTLLKVMLDQNTPASTKVRAADSVMNHALRAMELEDVMERLEDLERAAGLSKSSGRY